MLIRLSLAVLLATTALTRAQPADLPTSVEATGNAVRGCIGFPNALDAGADSHPSDWLALSPAVEPAVSVAGGQLCLDGLAWGTRYAVIIRPGLRFADRTVAPAGHATIETPDRDPAVAIAGRGWILPRQGNTGVTVQTMNVPRVRVRVLRLAAAPLAARLPAVTDRYDMKIDPRKQQFTPYELQSLAANATTEIWSGIRPAPHAIALSKPPSRWPASWIRQSPAPTWCSPRMPPALQRNWNEIRATAMISRLPSRAIGCSTPTSQSARCRDRTDCT